MGFFDFLKRKKTKQNDVQSDNTIEQKNKKMTLSPEERYGRASLKGYKTGNWSEAIVEFQKLEDEGFGEASIALAQLAQASNATKALAHYRKAAEKGLAEAAWGCAANLGHDFIADIKGKDKEWYRYCLQAARGGCSDAMHELGKIYDRMDNYLSAFYWYLLSGYYEHKDGFYDVSELLKKWKDNDEPEIDTSEWNPEEEIEDGSSPLSENALSIWKIYTKETQLTPNLLNTLFRTKAMPGSELVALFLGHFNEDVAKNDNNAKMSYQVAANSGSIMGMKCLGDMQAYGKGCQQDLEKAFSWYMGAAEECEKTACFIMGEFTRQRNPYLAAYYYAVALRRGYDPAFTRLQQM